MRALDEGLQDEGLEAGVEEEEVAPVDPRLVDLVGGDDEIVDEDGDIDGGARGVEIRQAAVGAHGLGDHGDAGGAAGGVEAGQHGHVPHPAEVGEGGGDALDLRDDGDRAAAGAQGVEGVGGAVRLTDPVAHLLQGHLRLALRDDGAGRCHHLLEGCHRAPPRA